MILRYLEMANRNTGVIIGTILVVASLVCYMNAAAKQPVQKTLPKVNSFTDYHTLSKQLFPSAWNKTGSDYRQARFKQTDRIQAGYNRPARNYDPAKPFPQLKLTRFKSESTSDLGDRVDLTIRWQIKNIKRIAMYNMDATPAGYQCCSRSSMETTHCISVATLLAYYDFPRGSSVTQTGFRARYPIVTFRTRRVNYGKTLIEVETWDGKFFRHHVWLYHSPGFHTRCFAQR